MSEGGYVEGSIESTEGDKVIVKIGKDEKKILKKDQVQQVVTNSLVHYLNKPFLFAVKNFLSKMQLSRIKILQLRRGLLFSWARLCFDLSQFSPQKCT